MSAYRDSNGALGPQRAVEKRPSFLRRDRAVDSTKHNIGRQATRTDVLLEWVRNGMAEAARGMHVGEKSPDGARNQREGCYKTDGYGEDVIHGILLSKYP
jgi:hypothetical protein